MKVLILGVNGMLGHRLFLELNKGHDVYATARALNGVEALVDYFKLDSSKIFAGIETGNLAAFREIITEIKPDVVINCIGIIKQVTQGKDPISSIAVNSLFPHQIAKICDELNSRFIHLSTDCVFKGDKGNYTEDSSTDAADLYGRSKQMGEVDYLENSLTIRTSIIGREIFPHGGLLEWFLNEPAKEVTGFTKAIFSGFPTKTLAHVIGEYILPNRLSGLYHVSLNPIDKYTLLEKFNNIFNQGKTIHKDEGFVIDRSLDSTRFREETAFSPEGWDYYINDLKVDYEFYEQLSR